MNFLNLPREAWPEFFDGMTDVLRGKLVEIEVVGLDLGEQIEAEWMPLQGLTYEPKQDILFIYAGGEEEILDHAIRQPKQIGIELGEGGVNRIAVVDAEGEEEFIALRSPLALPAAASLLRPDASSSGAPAH